LNFDKNENVLIAYKGKRLLSETATTGLQPGEVGRQREMHRGLKIIRLFRSKGEQDIVPFKTSTWSGGCR